MNKIKAILTLVLATIAISFAQPRGFDNDKPEFMREKMKEMLNLTEAQQQKLDKMYFKNQEERIDFRAKMEKYRLEMHEMMMSDNFDINKMKELSKKMNDLRSVQQEKRLDHFSEVYNILDENQRKIWKDHFNGSKNNRSMGMGRKGSKGNGRGMGNCQGYGPRF